MAEEENKEEEVYVVNNDGKSWIRFVGGLIGGLVIGVVIGFIIRFSCIL